MKKEKTAKKSYNFESHLYSSISEAQTYNKKKQTCEDINSYRRDKSIKQNDQNWDSTKPHSQAAQCGKTQCSSAW